MFDNNDNNSGNNGILSKFRLRLRLIIINRYKKFKKSKTNQKEEDDKFVSDVIKKIHDNNRDNEVSKDYVVKGRRGISRGKFSNVKKKIGRAQNKEDENKDIDDYVDDIGKKVRRDDREATFDKESNVDRIEKKDRVDGRNKKRDATYDKSSNQKKRGFVSGVIKNIGNSASDRVRVDDKKKAVDNVKKADDYEKIDVLRVKIINSIKREFEKKNSELDVLESELYFIAKDNDNAIELEKVCELKKKIQDIIRKINEIIEQYNIYNHNYELDDSIYIDNNSIVDDIIDYKNLVDSYKLNRDLFREYKLLDEFRELYNKLDHISDAANALISDNQSKIEEFDIRDKKYDDIKKGVVKSDKVLKDCDLEIEKQNKYFEDLMSKIGDIDSKEYSIYVIKGMEGLLGQSLKYVSLLALSPLAGLIPSIYINTLATRRIIKNIYSHMHIEKVEKIRYEAYNYDIEIGNKLNDLDYTYALIDDTMGVIDRLKSDFLSQYNSNIPGYRDTLRKINSIRDKVRDNRYKMDIIKSNLIASKKINSDKMVKVKKLNSQE